MLLTWGLTTSGVAIGFSKGGTQAPKARGIEVPKAPSRWGMGRGCPPPQWGGVWGGKCPAPEIFFKICLKIVHSGVTLQNFNTKFLVYYLIIPLKNFFVMPKGGQAQGPPPYHLLDSNKWLLYHCLRKGHFLLCFS